MASFRRQRVIVGMSGGVDSSVAALLLKQQAYEVEGLFMKNWEDDDADGACSAAQDLEDARQVCEVLGIPLHKVNFSLTYRERVFADFLQEYQAGRTPNPDVLCNKEIKFKVFLEYALKLGADLIATGHYVRTDRTGWHYRLLKGRDRHKDQSYFLYTLGQWALARSVFPLGDLEKSEVRSLAAQAGFTNHAKKDSTGMCFIGKRHFRTFLARYLPPRPGEIRDINDQRVGTHEGLMFYTLGQRQGLGIGGRSGALNAPWYVVRKEVANNVLVVAQGHDHPSLHHQELEASHLEWVAGQAPALPWRGAAKTRYRQADECCVVDRLEQGRCCIRFDRPQRALTPGQSVVFYQEEACIGGV
jgi:tRNA (5-methylaminomethyl-2-thiouridylate)-methyltransferase